MIMSKFRHWDLFQYIFSIFCISIFATVSYFVLRISDLFLPKGSLREDFFSLGFRIYISIFENWILGSLFEN